MALALSHPFRFVRGKAVTVNSLGDEYAAQLIAQAVQTGKGELPLTPTYGSDSPEFGTLDTSGLLYTISTFHPHIAITKISQEVDPLDETVKIKVDFNNVGGM